ncbi:MAG: internal scaffolding protein [Arizlama microvirus]|nr:MAG: internal scaffolding protein [Arizlama microvirus]
MQSGAEEADINFIIRQYGLTGKAPTNIKVPTYGDFDYVGDYQTALQAIAAAESSFMLLDPNVRLRFENNPQKFLEFCDDPGNIDEMRKLGLAVPVAIPDQPSASEAS